MLWKEEVMRKKQIIIAGIILIVAILMLMIGSKYFDVQVRFGQKPIGHKPPTISFLIMNGEQDEVIHQKILESPSLLHEKSPDELLDLKTPIITAIAYKRYELLKFIIKQGAPVKESQEILKKSNNDQYLTILDKIINEMAIKG